MTTASPTATAVKTSNKGLGYALPHKMGRALWAPMWLMALMAFAVGFILAIAKGLAWKARPAPMPGQVTHVLESVNKYFGGRIYASSGTA